MLGERIEEVREERNRGRKEGKGKGKGEMLKDLEIKKNNLGFTKELCFNFMCLSPKPINIDLI